METRCVVTTDIPGAFLHADIDELVHVKFKGTVESMGTGSIWSHSVKQKINAQSFTEAKLVAVDNMMPQILWIRFFLTDQGLSVGPIKILQDSKSTILLEENGIASSSDWIRHKQILQQIIYKTFPGLRILREI